MAKVLIAIDMYQRNNEEKTEIGEGFDFDSGYGLIDAEAAIDKAGSYYIVSKPNTLNDSGSEIEVSNINQAGAGTFGSSIFFISLIIFRRYFTRYLSKL